MAGLSRLRARLQRVPLLERLLAGLRRRRHAALLRRSGLVDEEYYRLQAGRAVEDSVAHYLEQGADRDLSPHPLFDPEHYLSGSPAARRSAAPAFAEFLDVGCHRALSPHPAFDAAAYRETVPEARTHPHDAFGHFCDGARAVPPLDPAHVALLGRAVVDPTVYAREAAEALTTVRSRPGPPPADATTFDHEAAARLVASVRAGTSQRPRPTVSVVLPTRDRRDLVAAAIASVRAQTWPAWELVVVDDGGRDGTDELVAEAAAEDDRITYVWQEHGGVASARNRGIAATTGTYVAYLDSDNTWEPTFLEVMVGVLQTEAGRAAHAASELHHPDGVRYRSRAVDTSALLARNHVDCITLVHERSLLEEVGTFDETLERFVDWDLLLRLSRVTELRHVPFVGTRYEVGREVAHERLTTSRSAGWGDVVQARHLVDWTTAPAPVSGLVSVVVVLGPEHELPAARLARLLDEEDLEVVVVDRGLPEPDAVRLRLAAGARHRLHVVTPPVAVAPGVARLLGCVHARGEQVVLVEAAAGLEADHVQRLAATAAEVDGVVGPLLVDDRGLVVGGAATVAGDGDVLRWGVGCPPDDDAVLGRAGSEPAPIDQPAAVEAVQQGVVALPAELLRELGGPQPLFVGGGAVVDLCRRAADGAAPVLLARQVQVSWEVDPATVGGRPRPDDRAELARRWSPAGGGPVEDPGTRGGSAVAEDAFGQVRLVADRGAGVPRRWDVTPRATRRRWAIATCVPDPAAASSWGDWHFALGLRDALRGLGEHAVVDTVASRTARDLGRDDVHVLLRGVNPVPAVPGACNLLWVISHPSDVSPAELAAADHVFVAGSAAAADLDALAPGTAVEVLLQCTDPRRFFPQAGPHAGEAGDEVLFVGNSRGQRRPVLEAAAAAGLRPTVIGEGWEGLVPADWIEATHVPNDQLAARYSRAGVVLNDHWPDMAAGGIVSNRLFDVVAAGGVAVSDRVAGIEDLFGDRVHVHDGPHDLRDAVAAALAVDRTDDTTSHHVRTAHSFVARARRLREVVDRLGVQAATIPGAARGRQGDASTLRSSSGIDQA